MSVDGEVDGEEVLDEVAGGVDVACRELDKVASDEVLTELWRGWKSLCLQMASSSWKGMCACVRAKCGMRLCVYREGGGASLL